MSSKSGDRPSPAGAGAPSAPAARVNPRSGEIDDPSLEHEFRLATLAGEKRLATYTAAIAAVLLLVFGANDWLVYRDSPTFVLLTGVRVMAALACVVAAVGIRGAGDPARVDLWLSSTLVLLALVVAGLSAFRPTASSVPHLINVLALTAIVGANPGPVRNAVPGALTLAAGIVLVLLIQGPPRDPLARVTIPTVLLAGGGLSLMAARAVQRQRRELYLALRAQQEAFDRLQRTQAELRTLRGILPICSHCSRIRDHAGAWHGLADYITERSEAAFSHGICPDCAREHWSEVLPDVAGGPRP
jgi:hypothetical protein